MASVAAGSVIPAAGQTAAKVARHSTAPVSAVISESCGWTRKGKRMADYNEWDDARLQRRLDYLDREIDAARERLDAFSEQSVRIWDEQELRRGRSRSVEKSVSK